jgi:hypothetical protein
MHFLHYRYVAEIHCHFRFIFHLEYRVKAALNYKISTVPEIMAKTRNKAKVKLKIVEPVA